MSFQMNSDKKLLRWIEKHKNYYVIFIIVPIVVYLKSQDFRLFPVYRNVIALFITFSSLWSGRHGK